MKYQYFKRESIQLQTKPAEHVGWANGDLSQSWTNKDVKLDWERTRIFSKNLSMGLCSEWSKKLKEHTPRFFPRHLGVRQNFHILLLYPM